MSYIAANVIIPKSTRRRAQCTMIQCYYSWFVYMIVGESVLDIRRKQQVYLAIRPCEDRSMGRQKCDNCCKHDLQWFHMISVKKENEDDTALITWQCNGLQEISKKKLNITSWVFYLLLNHSNSLSSATPVSFHFEAPVKSMNTTYDTKEASKSGNSVNWKGYWSKHTLSAAALSTICREQEESAHSNLQLRTRCLRWVISLNALI